MRVSDIYSGKLRITGKSCKSMTIYDIFCSSFSILLMQEKSMSNVNWQDSKNCLPNFVCVVFILLLEDRSSSFAALVAGEISTSISLESIGQRGDSDGR